MLGTTYKPNTIYLLIALLCFAVIALYIYADAIAITAPPWDFCGFNQTHIGTSFTCIAFDSDVVIIK
jgi:hypothetical protein